MLEMKFDEITKLRLKSVLRSKLRLRCSKHPRYNPAEGRGAIRGCCAGCEDAYGAYEAVIAFRQALARYMTATGKFEKSKPRTRKVKVETKGQSISLLNSIADGYRKAHGG